MKFRGGKLKGTSGKGEKHSSKDWKNRSHGYGTNAITGPSPVLFTSGSSSEWVLTVRPELELEIRKENLEIFFKDPANAPVVAGVAIQEYLFTEVELNEATWIQAKLDAANVIEDNRHNQCLAAIAAQFPVGANRARAEYEETLRRLENQSKIALKRSDYEREFQTLNDNRLKRKKEYDENLAKCLKTITGKIGPAILMRVNQLILDNRWRQVYHDLSVNLAGTSGGMEHKEAIYQILQNFTWSGRAFDEFVTEMGRLFEQVESAGWPVNDELKQYHLKASIKKCSNKIFHDVVNNYEFQPNRSYGDLLSRLQQKWAVTMIERAARNTKEELHTSVQVTPEKGKKTEKKKPKLNGNQKALVLSVNNPNKDYTCGKCGRKGHVEKDCWNDKLVCYNCGKEGHTANTCPVADGRGRQVRMNAAQEEDSERDESETPKVNIGAIFKKKLKLKG